MPVPSTFNQFHSEQAFRARQAQKADVQTYHRGITGDGQGVVAVSGKPGYLYVRLPELKNVTVKCYNGKGVPEVEGIPVVVGYLPEQPNLLQIVNFDLTASVTEVDNTGKISPSSTGLHGTTHEWFGGDTTLIHLRQFTPLRVTKAATGNFTVTVARGVIPTDTGWNEVEQVDINLSSDQAALATGTGQYVLIYIDRDGVAQYKLGDAKTTGILSYRDLPYPAPFGGYALAGVRLYAGQTEIEETTTVTDIVDLRFPQVNYYNIVNNLIAALENMFDIQLSQHILTG